MTAPSEKGQTENKNLTQDATFPSTQNKTEIREESLSSIVDEIAEELSGIIFHGDNLTPSFVSINAISIFLKRIPVKTVIGDEGKAVGLFFYDGGVYRKGEDDIKAMYYQVMEKIGLLEKVRSYTPYVRDFIAQLSGKTATRETPASHLVLYKDRLFDWRRFIYQDELYLTIPSPDYFVLHRVPWSLDVDVLTRNRDRTYEEVLKEFYDETVVSRIFEQWTNGQWPVLLEIIGYCLLSGDYPLNKAIMLVDKEGREGRNGKSTFLSLLESLLGHENVSHISLQDLTHDDVRFMRWNLYGKMANIYADLPTKALKETGHFKALTGEDYITADVKHKAPVTFKNYAKLIFSTNQLPHVSDWTDAFWRRWIVVEFPNRFEDNPGFSKMLRNELLPKEAGKILSYSLLAIKHVIIMGKFSFQEEEGSYREKWLRKANSVYAFLRSGEEQGFLEFGSDKREESKSLYSAYQRWCDEEEREIVSPKKFTEELEKFGYPKRTIGGDRYYIGLSLKRKGILI